MENAFGSGVGSGVGACVGSGVGDWIAVCVNCDVGIVLMAFKTSGLDTCATIRGEHAANDKTARVAEQRANTSFVLCIKSSGVPSVFVVP